MGVSAEYYVKYQERRGIGGGYFVLRHSYSGCDQCSPRSCK